MFTKNQKKIFKIVMMNIAQIYNEYPQIQESYYIPEILASAQHLVSQMIFRLKSIPELSLISSRSEQQELMIIQNMSQLIAFECLRFKGLLDTEETEQGSNLNPENSDQNGSENLIKINILKNLLQQEVLKATNSFAFNSNFENLFEFAKSQEEFTNLRQDMKFKSALILLMSDARTLDIDNLFMKLLAVTYKEKKQQVENIMLASCMDITSCQKDQKLLQKLFQQLIQMI